jgi:hypothetical protein
MHGLSLPPTGPSVSLERSEESVSGASLFLVRLGRAFDRLVGGVTVILVLAVISAIPLLNLLSLGYLLEASGRVARSGRLRDGWIGLAGFAVVGKILLAGWIALLPVRLVHSFWRDAELIAPGSANATTLRAILVILLLAVSLHLLWAVIRGGKWRHFLWPAPLRFLRWIGSDLRLSSAWGATVTRFRSLHLLHFFRLGALGFAGALLWLALPVLILMAAATFANPGISLLTSLLGSILLGLAVLYLPYLQTRFALTGRFREFLDPFAARRSFRKAPLAFWLALAATLLFALPLYLLKIELTPAEVAWLPNVVFVLFIFPARLLLGWSLARAERRETARIWVSRWAARLAALPVVAVYVFFVWISQYLSWHGSLGLLEQHAFLVPAPLLGL